MKIADDPQAPGDLGTMAARAVAEADMRRGLGERIIFVLSGDQLFCLNAVYASSL